MKSIELSRTIDCHAHFLPNAYGPDCDPATYIEKAEAIGITDTIVCASPTPRINLGDSIIYPFLWKWDVDLGKYTFTKQRVMSSGYIDSESVVEANPYNEVNTRVMEIANLKQSEHRNGLNIYLACLHHPTLDTTDEIEYWLRQPRVKAIKIHGISTAIGPNDVSDEIIQLSKRYRKPFIVHTDFSNQESSSLHRLRLQNSSLGWIRWAIANDLKVMITHAARLSLEGLSLINKSPNFILGCAPDLLLKSEPDRLESQPIVSIFQTILNHLDSCRVVFDTDYQWNVFHKNQWQDIDWGSKERMESTLYSLGLKEKTPLIFTDNAVRFFNLDS